MSFKALNRSERHLLAGLLLRVRAAVYVVAGIPILLLPPLTLGERSLGAVVVVLVAVAPFGLRRTSHYAGVRFSAVVDLIVAYVIWFIVPWAGPLSLFLTLSAVAMVAFLSDSKSAVRVVIFAGTLEFSKIAVILTGTPGDPAASGTSALTDAGLVVARAFALGCAYIVFRSIDRYFRMIAVASETGSERYRRLMDAAPTGYLVAVESEIVYANEAAADLLNRPCAHLVGATFADLVAPSDRDRVVDGLRAATEWLEPIKLLNVRLDTGGGEDRWVDATCSVIEQGSALAVQVALHDRSGQRQAEINLYKTELDYREFFERIPVALYRTLPDGTITQANAALLDIFGFTSEDDLTSLNARDLYVNPSDRERLAGLLEDSDEVVGFDALMRRVDGQVIWVRVTSRGIEGNGGFVYEGSLVDITRSRAIEDDLWARATQQEAAATIGQLALETDDIGTVLGDITDLVSRVLGTDGVLVLRRGADGALHVMGGSSGCDLTPDAVATVADRAHMTAAPVLLRTEGDIRFVAPMLADVGVQACAAVTIPGVDADFGTLVVVANEDRLFTADDINFLLAVANVLAAAIDRSKANAKLEELVRAKDAFVASVSHELRTPLTVVTGLAHELNERWMDLTDEELGEFTAMLVEQSNDMSDLIDDLLVAARSSIGNVVVRRERVDLKQEVESVLSGFTDTGRSTIVVRVEPGIVTADPMRVRQILRNLVTNALRYGGPNIEVVTSLESGTIAVECIDDGDGIPTDDRERIFVAYERAHHVEGQPGSVGLGLTVSRTLAELMNGSLTYEFDGRSTFRLELPRAVTDELESRPDSRVSSDEIVRGERTVGADSIGVDVTAVE